MSDCTAKEQAYYTALIIENVEYAEYLLAALQAEIAWLEWQECLTEGEQPPMPEPNAMPLSKEGPKYSPFSDLANRLKQRSSTMVSLVERLKEARDRRG